MAAPDMDGPPPMLPGLVKSMSEAPQEGYTRVGYVNYLNKCLTNLFLPVKLCCLFDCSRLPNFTPLQLQRLKTADLRASSMLDSCRHPRHIVTTNGVMLTISFFLVYIVFASEQTQQ